MKGFLNQLAARSFGTASSFRPRLASLFEAPQRDGASPSEPLGIHVARASMTAQEPSHEGAAIESFEEGLGEPDRDNNGDTLEQSRRVRVRAASHLEADRMARAQPRPRSSGFVDQAEEDSTGNRPFTETTGVLSSTRAPGHVVSTDGSGGVPLSVRDETVPGKNVDELQKPYPRGPLVGPGKVLSGFPGQEEIREQSKSANDAKDRQPQRGVSGTVQTQGDNGGRRSLNVVEPQWDRGSLSPPPDRSLRTAASEFGQASEPVNRRNGRHPFDGAPASAPEPSIHITIGRIDVRAELPEPPQRRTQPRSTSGISLEEYLGRKAGERS